MERKVQYVHSLEHYRSTMYHSRYTKHRWLAPAFLYNQVIWTHISFLIQRADFSPLFMQSCCSLSTVGSIVSEINDTVAFTSQDRRRPEGQRVSFIYNIRTFHGSNRYSVQACVVSHMCPNREQHTHTHTHAGNRRNKFRSLGLCCRSRRERM